MVWHMNLSCAASWACLSFDQSRVEVGLYRSQVIFCTLERIVRVSCENLFSGFRTRSDANQSVQLQRIAGSLRF